MLEKSGPERSVFLQFGISHVALTAAPQFVWRLGIGTIRVLIKNMFSYGLLRILPLLQPVRSFCSKVMDASDRVTAFYQSPIFFRVWLTVKYIMTVSFLNCQVLVSYGVKCDT